MPATAIWVKANRIFDQVSRLEADHRTRRVAELCGDDAALADCVARLLNADHQLEQEDFDTPAELGTEVVDEQLIGQRVGAYQIEKQIGEGGMGGVFRGRRQTPGQPELAALKVLKPGLDRRRFVLERQLLEKLTHPNIARLIDGGELADGRPYVVLEYIRGEPITRFCRGKTLRPTLNLFRTLCQAVAYAHATLVVHRDIKPSNVLVASDGTLKLLDFGIAKLMAQSSDLANVSTLSRLRPMTPEYSSPEQVLGETISTRTDVYLLGVLLYELLSGVNPLKAVSQAKRLRDITQGQPLPAPSRTAVPASLLAGVSSRLQRLDLDRITLKAVCVDPDERYQSVGDLVADLENFLEGQPVRARGRSRGYRAAKFLRRNPVGSAMAALLVALLLGISALSAHHAQELREQMARTSAENRRAEHITNLLIESFTEADPTRGHASLSTRDLLLKAAERLERDDQTAPPDLARLRLAVASVMARLSMYDEALSQLDQVDALSRRADLAPRQHFEVHRLLAHIGTETGRWRDAGGSIARAQEALARINDERTVLAASVDLEIYAARLLARQGEASAAGLAYERALAQAAGYGADPAVTRAYISLEYSEMLLANGQEDQAEAMLEQAHRSAPSVLETAPFWIQMIRAQARRAIRRGDYSRALIVYNRGLARAGASFGQRSEEVAGMLSGMGTANERLGQRQVATQLYLKAFDISRARVRDGDFVLVERSLNLAQLLAFDGHYTEAAALLGNQLEQHRRHAEVLDSDLPYYEQALGRLQLNAHNPNGARASYQKALLTSQRLPTTPARERFSHQTRCEMSLLRGYEWQPLPLRLLESCLPAARRNLTLSLLEAHSGLSSGATIQSRLLEELD
ncbi:MAG: serine/threonine-protein kinase [Pseudomonadota bacterium]